MRPRTRSFFLILSSIITVSARMVVSPKVTVSRGEDAILNCTFTNTQQQHYSGLITVKWLARVSNAAPFFQCSVRNDSTDRVSECSLPEIKYSLYGNPRQGELSLLIRKVQLNDNGAYFCRVELDNNLHDQQQTHLHVTGEPQILNLSLVRTASSSDSAPRRLQCDVEGNPQPKIVWLLPSRRMMEERWKTESLGPYRVISSVSYQEDQVLTCRAESELGDGAERTYPPSDPPSNPPSDPSSDPPSDPPSNTLMITLIVCGTLLPLLLLLLTGVTVHCLRNRARVDGSPIYDNVEENDGLQAREGPLVYSLISPSGSSTPPRVKFTRQQLEESGVLYSAVNHQQ